MTDLYFHKYSEFLCFFEKSVCVCVCACVRACVRAGTRARACVCVVGVGGAWEKERNSVTVLDKKLSSVQKYWYFSYFSTKAYVVGTLRSTSNMFSWKVKKTIYLIPILSRPMVTIIPLSSSYIYCPLELLSISMYWSSNCYQFKCIVHWNCYQNPCIDPIELLLISVY